MMTPAPETTQPFTVLVLGTDGAPSRAAAGDVARADAIMVVSVDAGNQSVAIVSLPRDTVDIPMPDGGTWPQKVNEMYPRLGPVGMRSAMESLLGIEIHRYIAVDMAGFVSLIDAVGGIFIAPQEPLNDPSIGFWLPAGTHHVDGSTALTYVRHRKDGDYARAARQQQALLSMLNRVSSGEVAVDYFALAASLPSLDTDISAAEFVPLLELARLSRSFEIRSLVLQPPRFALFEGMAGERGWIMVPNVDEIRLAVADLIRN